MKKAFVNLSVSLVASIIFLLVVEGTVQFFSSRWFNRRFHESPMVLMFGNCRTSDFGTSQSRAFFRIVDYPPGLLYENLPGASGILFGKRVEINSAGMRDDEISLDKPAGSYRIAMLGDSVVFGYGAEQKYVLSEVLERKINESGVKAEVMNFGAPGYSTKQEIVQLENKTLQYKPDLIIVAQHPNDIYGTGVTSLTPSPILKFIAEHSKLLGCFNEGGRLISSEGVREDNRPSGTSQEVYAKDSETWKNYRALFYTLGEISKRENIPIIIVTLPEFKDLNEKYEYGYIHDEVGAQAEQAGLKVIKMHPPLVAYDEDALNYRAFPDDIDHPNAKGHAKLAEIIYNNLIEYNLLPTNGPIQ